jgi:hypothetical protein
MTAIKTPRSTQPRLVVPAHCQVMLMSAPLMSTPTMRRALLNCVGPCSGSTVVPNTHIHTQLEGRSWFWQARGLQCREILSFSVNSAFYDCETMTRNEGGMISLMDKLKFSAPSLSELVLTGPMPHAALRQDCIMLPALCMLRLRTRGCGCPFFNLQTSYWAVPSSRMSSWKVAGAPWRLRRCGGRLEGCCASCSWKLGTRWKAMWMDDVGKIVDGCPQIGCGGVLPVHSGQCTCSPQRYR